MPPQRQKNVDCFVFLFKVLLIVSEEAVVMLVKDYLFSFKSISKEKAIIIIFGKIGGNYLFYVSRKLYPYGPLKGISD